MFTFCCTFKCNKTYYSRFYSFDIFKARWSQAKVYRKAMSCFGIFSIVLDALIICVCVAALLEMELFSSMLWITIVEIAVLSLCLILLGCIELYKLKTYLRYNEQPVAKWGITNKRQKLNVATANELTFLAEKDTSDRVLLKKNFLFNARTNNDMFMNNKLEDLLHLFGDRRCKSMIELGTGWSKEDDPRRNITWPLSPSKIREYDGEYHFTRDDMYYGYSNVYHDIKDK